MFGRSTLNWLSDNANLFWKYKYTIIQTYQSYFTDGHTRLFANNDQLNEEIYILHCWIDFYMKGHIILKPKAQSYNSSNELLPRTLMQLSFRSFSLEVLILFP